LEFITYVEVSLYYVVMEYCPATKGNVLNSTYRCWEKIKHYKDIWNWSKILLVKRLIC